MIDYENSSSLLRELDARTLSLTIDVLEEFVSDVPKMPGYKPSDDIAALIDLAAVSLYYVHLRLGYRSDQEPVTAIGVTRRRLKAILRDAAL
jgi:hypothetical protein